MDSFNQQISRRQWLQTLCAASLAVSLAAALSLGSGVSAQGRCMLTLGSPACNTTDIKPVFEPTGWKTVALEQITFRVADYKKEAAFYAALMGWTLRTDDGKQAVMDVGDWGSVIFKSAPPAAAPVATDAAPPAGGRAGRGGGGGGGATVESFGFVIEPWNAAKVEAELRKRGLTPVADNGANGFESFHVKDPDGFDLQLSNGNGLAKARKTRSTAKLTQPAPFESTGWSTVWLDHFSFGASNYKESASFYMNLLGWKATYDEGSQNELLMSDVGNIIIRGGNPLNPAYRAPASRSARIDHISFGIAPWDTDGVKDALEKRGLRAQIDTSSRHQDATGNWVPDEIHTAAFKSYHTQTPNGYNLQISYVTKDIRLSLSNAVKPKK